MSTAGRRVTGTLIQGEDGTWREVPKVSETDLLRAYTARGMSDPEEYAVTSYVPGTNPRRFVYVNGAGTVVLGSSWAFALTCAAYYGQWTPEQWTSKNNKALLRRGIRVVPEQRRAATEGGDGTWAHSEFWEQEVS